VKKILFIVMLALVGAGYYFYDKVTGYREVEFCVAVTSDLGRGNDVLPRAVTALRDVSRSCAGRMIVIDNGGLFAVGAAERIVRAEDAAAGPEARFLAAAGYHFVNLSPDVFQLGAQAVRRFLQGSGTQPLTDNLRVVGGGKRKEVEGIQIAAYGLSAASEAALMPKILFDGMTFDNPFTGGARPHDELPADFSVLTLRADIGDLAARFGIEPADILLSLHTQFPHLSLVVMNDRFPDSLVTEATGGTHFVALERGNPALAVIRVRMIKHDAETRGVIVSIDTIKLSLEKIVPDPQLRDITRQYAETMKRAKERIIGTPWYGIDLSGSRSGDTPAARLLHETLLAAAVEAGYAPELSVALTPMSPYRHEAGAAMTLGELDALVPYDRHPVVATISGSRLADLLQSAWEKYPAAAASLFPLYYRVQSDGVFRFADGRFDPDRTYLTVLDGRIADLLVGGVEGETTVKAILPETLATRLARGVPAKLSYQYTPLWKSE